MGTPGDSIPSQSDLVDRRPMAWSSRWANGDPNVRTPNIDRLCPAGVNFAQARSGFLRFH
jgi:hypothetical protein